MDNKNTCCFSGHRFGGFNFHHSTLGQTLTEALDKAVLAAINDGSAVFLTGMAMGFDILAAERVLLHQKSFRDIKLAAILPFKNQAQKYPRDWRRRFEDVLIAANEVIILNERYFPGCYHGRNRYLIENSRRLICYFSGKKSGTGHTYGLAQKAGLDIINLWNDDFGNVADEWDE